MKLKLISFSVLTIFAFMAQLKPSEGLNLEVSMNAAKDVEADTSSEFYTGDTAYGRSSLLKNSTGQATLSCTVLIIIVILTIRIRPSYVFVRLKVLTVLASNQLFLAQECSGPNSVHSGPILLKDSNVQQDFLNVPEQG